MKRRIALTIVISVVLALGLAGIAVAQSVCDTAVFTPGTGVPGGTETVCGSVPVATVAGADSGLVITVVRMADVTVTFDGADVGSATSDEYGYFCAAFTIPADATVGTHTVGIAAARSDSTCETEFAVGAASIAPVAEVPVATVTTLPSTGFFLVPAGGLLVGGLGTLLFRKRRR